MKNNKFKWVSDVNLFQIFKFLTWSFFYLMIVLGGFSKEIFVDLKKNTKPFQLFTMAVKYGIHYPAVIHRILYLYKVMTHK